MMRGLVRRRLGDDSEAEDVAQQTFLAALEALPTLRNRERPVSWFGAIAMRTTCKWLRQRATRRASTELAPNTQLENLGRTAFDTTLARVELAYIVGRAGGPDLIAYVLRMAEQRSLPEIAALTDASLSTTKRRIAKTHAMLRATASSCSSEAQ